MVLALLTFAFISGLSAAATMIALGFSIWLALVVYSISGACILIVSALIVASRTPLYAPQNQHTFAVHS